MKRLSLVLRQNYIRLSSKAHAGACDILTGASVKAPAEFWRGTGTIFRQHPSESKRRLGRISSALNMAVMVGTDFLTVEVLTLKGLKTLYGLFFIHLESRRICLAGVTRHPDQEWTEQMARNITMEETGFLAGKRHLLRDRDSKHCASFCQLIEAEKVKVLACRERLGGLLKYYEREAA